ncbi:TPA: hypothetical protein BOS_17279 [Bos taurus]|nr:TPA: hypothetical protein BOS_17279 [Bos taurus]
MVSSRHLDSAADVRGLACVLCSCPCTSGRQEHKVVVDVDHGHVEGRHLVHAQGLVPGGVQLLDLQLPLHPLHSVESRCLMLLPHQETRGLTFMRSYLSSTSCSQDMNWRALNLSRTDLFSSPCRENQVHQHGASAERHRLVRDGPRRPAVDPQDLLFAGDDQFFLKKRGRRSFPRTASCCLNSSFRGSASEGGGAICGHRRDGLTRGQELPQLHSPRPHDTKPGAHSIWMLVPESRWGGGGQPNVEDTLPQRSMWQDLPIAQMRVWGWDKGYSKYGFDLSLW